MKLGKEKYLKQSRLEREEYVFNEIMKNKDKFSKAEILFSMKYIYKVRHGDWPHPVQNEPIIQQLPPLQTFCRLNAESVQVIRSFRH
ncbi:hypothetical protein NQ117_10250 [Paenibacillus sp. SC116]|uniref:zincin-like metallopeptidase toxin domain-containing protein n=1 Tax=Paenibacillus sp. SC116 TaxID=2968986 RepID=UPI00215AFFE1|nr:zincin-like metallopeptidase toxin domain-containing protein [Paenibacillus sp. SC116]MCR8844066.1 hypothetical protein [Paenibacillus sp. SC116]